jgi:predicted nucleic acid-binding protein
MYLLDTNMISELRNVRDGKADAGVARWQASVPASMMFISAISLLELEVGILRRERRDPSAASVLRAWLDDFVVPVFAQRTLPFDAVVARRSARLHVPNPRPLADAMIGATALVHGMTVVTRNERDFAMPDLRVLNPWSDADA